MSEVTTNEWKHVLIKGVRMKHKAKEDGTLYWLVFFAQDLLGEDCTWSVWVNSNDQGRVSFGSIIHLLIAMVKNPAQFGEYAKGVKDGDSTKVEKMRDDFYEQCRKAATLFAQGAAEGDTNRMNKVADSLTKQLQGQVFYIEWEVDEESGYGNPSRSALPVGFSTYNFRRDIPFGENADAPLIQEIIQEWEEGGDYYSFDQAFHDAQEGLLNAGEEFDEGLQMALAAAAEAGSEEEYEGEGDGEGDGSEEEYEEGDGEGYEEGSEEEYEEGDGEGYEEGEGDEEPEPEPEPAPKPAARKTKKKPATAKKTATKTAASKKTTKKSGSSGSKGPAKKKPATARSGAVDGNRAPRARRAPVDDGAEDDDPF